MTLHANVDQVEQGPVLTEPANKGLDFVRIVNDPSAKADASKVLQIDVNADDNLGVVRKIADGRKCKFVDGLIEELRRETTSDVALTQKDIAEYKIVAVNQDHDVWIRTGTHHVIAILAYANELSLHHFAVSVDLSALCSQLVRQELQPLDDFLADLAKSSDDTEPRSTHIKKFGLVGVVYLVSLIFLDHGSKRAVIKNLGSHG